MISTLVARQRKGQSTQYNTTNYGIAKPYIHTIISIFKLDHIIAPRVALQKFIDLHPVTDPPSKNYPSNKKIKSKISSLKAKHKKDNNNN